MLVEAPAPEESLVGRTIAGTYRVETLLGSGSYGSVYRAVRESDGTSVALKTLHARFVKDATAQARFRREARAASKLDHPYAVRLLDFGIEPDGTSFLVMELVEGRELFKVMYDEFPFSPERAVRVLTQVLDALGSAHAAGFVHRDLKPENVLLVEGAQGETVKVTDFGIAKTFAGEISEESMQLSADGMVHGTPEYMAPEQGRGDPVDGRADLYAAGVLLYEMLVGALPYEGNTPMDVILAHLTQAPVPPSKRRPAGTVHPGLERVALRALEKDPAKRFQSAESMREALENALAMSWKPGALDPSATRPTRRGSADSQTQTTSMEPPEVVPRYPAASATTALPVLRDKASLARSRVVRWALFAVAIVLSATLGALLVHFFAGGRGL